MIKTCLAMGMVALMAAATPFDGTSNPWAQWGLAGLVIAYTLWRDADRERRMSATLDRNHRWVQETLISALQHNTTVLDRISVALGSRAEEE